jgi:hypothetical protein
MSHAGFNNAVDGFSGAAIVTSPATMAYVTTETGVVTMLLVILLAGYLLIRRAADFDNLRPTRVPTVPSPGANVP